MSEKKDQDAAVSTQEFENLKEIVLQQSEEIQRLRAEQAPKPEKAAPLETPTDTFTVNKEKYQFTVPKFIVPDRGAVLAKDALNDKPLLEHLVLIKSGVIKPVK